MDPTDPTFDFAAAWRQDARTRWRPKNGPSTTASFVSVPVPDPAPGSPRFVPVRRDRGGAA